MADLIDRQAAIDIVRHECGEWKGLAKEIVKQFNGLPSVQPKWIPCSERMPEPESATYWVCTDTGCQCSCRWTNHNRFWPSLLTDWHWNPFDTPQYSKVIAWMPLPEPYKGERK